MILRFQIGKIFLLLIFLFFPGTVSLVASDDFIIGKDGLPPLKIQAGFMIHNFTNPGVSIDLDVMLLQKRDREIYVPINTVFYLHPKNSRVFYINTGIGYRWHSKGILFLSTSLCLGYIHSFVDGDLYAERNGEIVKIADTGQPGIMPYADFTVGMDFFEDQTHQFSPFFKLLGFGQYPYNGYMLPHFGFQLGAIYSFDKGGEE